eukprot:1143734-Pelagomonas_calceolata.AAC.4
MSMYQEEVLGCSYTGAMGGAGTGAHPLPASAWYCQLSAEGTKHTSVIPLAPNKLLAWPFFTDHPLPHADSKSITAPLTL